MRSKPKVKIQNQAQKFMKENGLKAHPVNLNEIADKFSIKICAYHDDEDSDYELDFSARALVENGQKIVEYNAEENPIRTRFLLAHTLAHHILEHKNTPFEAPSFYLSKDPIEQDANWFAEELLMPKCAVEDFFMGDDFQSIDAMASLFKVSRQAMQNRLIELDLWEPAEVY